MWKSVKLHFSIKTSILDFFISQQLFSWALEFSFVFKLLNNTVLSKNNEN